MQLKREIAATQPKSHLVIHPKVVRNKAERVTQCGRNAIPETITHPLQRSKESFTGEPVPADTAEKNRTETTKGLSNVLSGC